MSVTLTPVAGLGPPLWAVMVKVTLLPTFGVGLSTVLVIDRSVIGTGVVVAVAVLFARFGSLCVPVMVAVLAYGPVASTVATIVKVALPPFAIAPIVQVGDVHDPIDGVALTIEYPAGTLSVTLTPVAGLGPPLWAVMVKVTLLPTLGVGLSTVLVIERSVTGTGVVVTVAVLFVKSRSVCVPVMVAVLAYGPEARTEAMIVSVSVAPLERLPIVQVGDSQVPVDGVALTSE